MLSGDIALYPATTRQNQQVWSGIPNSDDVVLFMNSDLNATVYLGYVTNLVPNVNAIPVAPNASLQLPASRTVYAIWTTTTGVNPLVVIPGGNAYFLGLTQALGALAIPSIHSPNYVTGVSGWTIKQDGSAEFNNLTIRGTFLGNNFILNSSGLFFYSGTPALGNLIASITNAAGVDGVGNIYESGITSYQVSSGKTYGVGLNALSAAGLPGLSVQDVNHNPAAPAGFFAQSSSDPITPKAFAAITSGQETGPDVASFISIESALYSAVTGGQIILQAGDIQHLLNGWLIDYTASNTGGPLVTETTGDGQTYHIGHYAVRDNGVPHLINSTTPIVTLTTGNLAANKGYHIRGFVTYLGNQAAGAPIFSWGAAGGLVLSSQQNGWQDFEGGGVAPIIHNNDGALGAVTGPVFAASTTNWLYRFDIHVTVNTPGQLQVNAAENTAGDPFTIRQAYAVIDEY